MSEVISGQKACALYERKYGADPEVVALPGAGSDRRYYRLSSASGPVVVATESDNVKESRCFVGLADAFRDAGVAMPEIYATDGEYGVYLQEDLGDCQLLPQLATSERLSLSEKVLRGLAHLQTVDESVWHAKVISDDFSARQVMWDLNYFKYSFLKTAGIDFDESRLEDDFERLAGMLCLEEDMPWGFMYRDFQSRNIMIKDGELRWIDFQGGRRGPLLYDAVSFLWQAKARFTDEERKHLLRVYAEELSGLTGVAAERILTHTDVWAFFRTLQVLGAYGFRGLIEKRAHFIESIPDAIRNLSVLSRSGVLADLPELALIARKCEESRFASVEEAGLLTVKVFSFSYKRGYPEDLSGNGGGFMFDCRGMHNPGRYAEYKPLTGLDQPVIDFLEKQGEIQRFVEQAVEIVSPSIQRYADRGFSSLQIGFGCTGGRHRSVYCAQHVAEILATRFPGVRVELLHREQGLRRVYNELMS